MTVLRGINLVDISGDDVFPNAKDSLNRDVIRTIISDPISVSVTESTPVQSFNVYGEILAIAGNATEEVTAYTVALDSAIQLTQIDVSAANRSNIIIKINGLTIAQKRTWWGYFDVSFKFDLLTLSSLGTIEIEIKNNSTGVQDVYYNLQGRILEPSIGNSILLENGNPLLQENGNPIEV